MMVKLRKLHVQGFRGIRNDVEIDFGRKCQSVILFGDNGTGKTSFVDAVEWLLDGRIEHLGREGCGDRAYRHRLLADDEPALVEIVTSDHQLTGSRLLDGRRRARFEPEDSAFVQFVNQARGDTVILRYGLMRDFVDKTKSEKLRYLADILGLGALTQLRDELLKTVNKLRGDEEYRYLDTQIKDYEKRLCRVVGSKRMSAAEVLSHAESLRQELGGQTPISDIHTLQVSVNGLLALSQRDERARTIVKLRRNLSDLQPTAASDEAYRQIESLARDVTALQADKDAVDQIVLAELYKAGQEVVEREAGDMRLCPLCGQEVDRQKLLEHLCVQLEAIGEIKVRVERLESSRQRLRRSLADWHTWLTQVHAVAAGLDTPEGQQLQEATERMFVAIERWREGARGEGGPLRPVPELTSEERAAIRSFSTIRVEAVSNIEACLRRLEGDVGEKERYDKLEELDLIARNLTAWHRACRRRRHFERQIEAMTTIHGLCEQMERQALEEVLEAVSEHVNRYYLTLHPSEGFDQIGLRPTEARGVEFEFTFHGERISPPGALLSESHLNTLGICLFLASARHFNQHTRFLILDDVINSVDAHHRTPLARLLRDEFEDFQLLLLTHDRMWFDILRRTAPGWMTKEITGWSYEEGLRFKDGPGDLEAEARQSLQQGDLVAAGNKARQWLERVLKERCYDLQVPVAFRYNDRNEERMPGELLPALRGYIIKTQIYADSETLFRDLEASQFIGSRLSHDNIYDSAPPQPVDIEYFLQDIQRLDSLFLCPDCESYIAAKHTPSSARRKRCKCGGLELR